MASSCYFRACCFFGGAWHSIRIIKERRFHHDLKARSRVCGLEAPGAPRSRSSHVLVAILGGHQRGRRHQQAWSGVVEWWVLVLGLVTWLDYLNLYYHCHTHLIFLFGAFRKPIEGIGDFGTLYCVFFLGSFTH